jgi:hypothetical protein
VPSIATPTHAHKAPQYDTPPLTTSRTDVRHLVPGGSESGEVASFLIVFAGIDREDERAGGWPFLPIGSAVGGRFRELHLTAEQSAAGLAARCNPGSYPGSPPGASGTLTGEETMMTRTSARRVAGHVLMSKVVGWDLTGMKDVGQAIPGPFIARWETLEHPSVADYFADAFVSLAGPISSGELEVPNHVDVMHAHTLVEDEGFEEFVALVKRVLTKHKAALDELAASFESGRVSNADVNRVIKKVDPGLVGAITSPRALLPLHVPGAKPVPGLVNPYPAV